MSRSPGDAWRCFTSASDWKVIGGNLQRMWDGFTSTTIGEWLIYLAIPSMFASYILPFAFAYVLFQTFLRRRTQYPAGAREQHLRSFWGFYLIVGGAVLVVMGSPQSFEVWQGLWQVAVGVVVLMLSTSYWARLRVAETA